MEHKTQRTMAKKVFRILFMLLIAVFGIYLAIQFIIIFHRLQNRDSHRLHDGRQHQPAGRCLV